ncbi:tyrosine recombinase XerC [bacterium MnTg02]|nr:tyrosine recombinase XerC [bacterium MnTg02]
MLLSLPDGEAHQLASAWKVDKIRKGLSPASINRSMAALNSLVKSARLHGFTQLRMDAKGIKSKPYRDTRGPGTDGIQSLLAAAHNQDPRKAARDVAILRLGYGLGLRRGEIVSLNIGHADLEAGAVLVMGKGSSELEPLTLPANTKAALEAWLAVRGTDDPDAPLFVNVSRAHHGERMTGAGVYHLIRCYLGTKAGVIARPHGLRHTAITKALDVFSGDYRKARAFSRHASLDTVRRYDDNRADHGGQVAHAIDALVSD